MNWFLIALVAPALWSVSNHIDKYLVSKYFKGGGTGAMPIFSSGIGFLVLPVILVFHPEVLSFPIMQGLVVAFNGFIYIAALLPYIYALQRDEASIVVPLFQTIPVFGYILGYIFFGEQLTLF